MPYRDSNRGLYLYFFGEDSKKRMQLKSFDDFLKGLHDEIVRLEFAHYDFKNQVSVPLEILTFFCPSSAVFCPSMTLSVPVMMISVLVMMFLCCSDLDASQKEPGLSVLCSSSHIKHSKHRCSMAPNSHVNQSKTLLAL